MNRPVIAWLALLAVGTLSCGKAHAQARGGNLRGPQHSPQSTKSADSATKSQKLHELETWVGRLAGTFRVNGTVQQHLNSVGLTSRGIDGAMECARIGDGAGVHCVIRASFGNTTWSLGGGGGGTATPLVTYNTLNPAVLLFAIDPNSVRIKLMLVDDHSIADILSGLLIGDTVQLTSEMKGCWGSSDLPHCPWSFRFTAKPGSRVIRVETIWKAGGIRFDIQLNRESYPPAPGVEAGR